MSKLILAIESSCDETACAISRDGREILADVIYSQADMHALYGGVVPEIASRKHVEKISLVAEQAVKQAGIKLSDLDAVAATCAPGLIGALLVGANFAKATALALNKPFVPVHHIRGHVAANYVAFPQLEPPMTALVASGGHTVILDVEDYTHMTVVGASRDDAAGEAFDKIGRVLGLPYPGGAALDRLSREGDAGKYPLPPAIIKDHPYDFSFSGLKTAAVNLIHNAQQKGQEVRTEDLAAAVSHTVAHSVVPRVIAAAKDHGRKRICAAGGVAANSTLRSLLERECEKAGLELYLPPLKLCGDNGAMIACQAYFEYMAGNVGDAAQNCYATLPASEQVCCLENNL
ncbi:MAG: tRNA (adenosine(37)-N6)-threonylcarbamoyltransferase complex transferase subunit TsaD [Clostridia bacterium]|nr:tRNA (adenosine(37)-N6)-threonylcarbamoyltransferase complex transferase subunit TsaD [Oscillospiraceae bacterium]MBQ3534557.1 tRNA (adenosine(37)-N6)-threonylcarbamoyltransferase complex transferase subunit TsaD [Clostridia bacterium]